MMNSAKLKKEIERLVAKANFELRPDVLKLLHKAHENESNKKAKDALAWILENAKVAKKEKLAICQDTGLPIVFIEVGAGFGISFSLIKDIEKGVENGYKNNYLRASIVMPIERGKSSYRGIVSHIKFNPKIKGLKITILPKGFGSENKSQLKMFNPTQSLEKIEDFIVECVRIAGPEACPPFIVGVGIGSTSDGALLLAKKSLLERIDRKNKSSLLSEIEQRLLKRINALNIGPMGLGGKCTALSVKIKTELTHIAGLPVGVNISCHALRSAVITL